MASPAQIPHKKTGIRNAENEVAQSHPASGKRNHDLRQEAELPFHHIAYDVAGKHHFRTISKYGEALKEAESKVRELADGSQAAALTGSHVDFQEIDRISFVKSFAEEKPVGKFGLFLWVREKLSRCL